MFTRSFKIRVVVGITNNAYVSKNLTRFLKDIKLGKAFVILNIYKRAVLKWVINSY